MGCRRGKGTVYVHKPEEKMLVHEVLNEHEKNAGELMEVWNCGRPGHSCFRRIVSNVHNLHRTVWRCVSRGIQAICMTLRGFEVFELHIVANHVRQCSRGVWSRRSECAFCSHVLHPSSRCRAASLDIDQCFELAMQLEFCFRKPGLHVG